MKKLAQKILSVILAVAMLLSSMSVAFATDTVADISEVISVPEDASITENPDGSITITTEPEADESADVNAETEAAPEEAPAETPAEGEEAVTEAPVEEEATEEAESAPSEDEITDSTEEDTTSEISGDVTTEENETEEEEAPAAALFTDDTELSDEVAEETAASEYTVYIGEQGYADLTAALAAANAGDTIVLSASVASFPAITKSITIKGADDTVAINAAIAENFPDIEGTVTFENLIFNDRISTENASGDQSKMTLKFVDCTFNIPAGNTYAIQAGASWNNDVLGELYIEQCSFTTSAASFVKGYMVYAQCVEKVTVKNSSFDGKGVYRGAIHLGDSTDYATVATVEGNTIADTARGVQIGNRVEGSSVTITGNTIDVSAIDGETESAALYIHEVANAETTDVAVTNNALAADTLAVFSENTTGSVEAFVTTFTGNTENGTAITLEESSEDTAYVAPAPAISGTITDCLIDLSDPAETFIASEIEALNATESVVIKLYSGETQIAVTTLQKPEYYVRANLSVKIIITGESSSWKTEWADGMPRADVIPDKVVLYVDDQEMNSANVPMRSTNGELAVNWADVPGVAAAPTAINTTTNAAYDDLATAITSANSGETVQLAADYTYADGTKINIKVPTGVIIDGNGNELTIYDVFNGGANAAFYSDGSYTVKNLTIARTVTDNNPIAFDMKNGGTLENVTVNGTFGYGVLYGSNTTVSGCTFNSGVTYGASSNEVSGITNVSISGNTFKSTNVGILRGAESFIGNTVDTNGFLSVASKDVTVTKNIFGGSSYVEAWSDADVSGNYWGGEAPSGDQIKVMGGVGEFTVTSDSYYTTVSGDGTLGGLKEVAATSPVYIGETGYASLEAALAAAVDGDEIVIAVAGTYTVPTGKSITVTGKVDGVVFDNIGARNMGGANVTFNNVTFTYANDSTYKGLQHAGNLTYNNCIINGQVFLYGTSETFNNCTFNQTDSNNYNVWTYGAKTVGFSECTFNSAGKSVLVYNEGAGATDLNVVDTDFIASQEVAGKAAIEIDTSLMPAGTEIVVDAETTATGFATGSVSGDTLWNDKKANSATGNGGTNSQVTVAGVVVKPAAPVGTVTPAYTRADGFWGEGKSNASESYIVELYEGETKIASASLNDIDNIIDGIEKNLTWSIPFAGSTDEYWTVVWTEGYPKYDMNPDSVKLVVDSTVVATNVVRFGAPDYENNIVALAEGFTGGVVAYKTLTEAVGNFNGRKVNVLRDVTESVESFNGCTLTTNVEGGVTVTNTYDGWIYCNDFNIGSGVTVVGGAVFYETDSVNTIEGTLKVTETLYLGYDAKTTVQNGGNIVVEGNNGYASTIIRYNDNADSGLYIYGDGDDSTVEFSNDYYIGAYSGAFYAEDATIKTGYLLLDHEAEEDTYPAITMTLDNSKLEVTGVSATGQDDLTAIKDAQIVLKNGSALSVVGDYIADETVQASVDSTSTFTDKDGVAVPSAPVEVATYEELVAALEKDNANIIMTADITGDATQSSSYGKAGIVLNAGDVLDGNGHTLTINGANGTWDCAVAMLGGTVKNLTVGGAFRGIFMPGANGDVEIDNCVIKDTIYTFNSDGGNKDYNVTIKNTTLNGWTSYSDVHGTVAFEGCTFGEGNGYAYCRPYQATTFTNCEFNDGFEFDTTKAEAETLKFNECTYAGEALSAESAAPMFYNGGTVVIDDETVEFVEYIPVAKIGETVYTSIEAALKAAADGDTVELIWAEGDAPIAMNGAVYGNKTVTITGTAQVDWSKGWLFVGRGGDGDGKLIFEDANLTSTEKSLMNGAFGIHVSMAEYGEADKNNGEVVFENSNIDLSYLMGKNNVTVDGGELTVWYGFAVGARPAEETNNVQNTSTMTIKNGAVVEVKNHNGMGIGYESNGVLNVENGSTFKYIGSELEVLAEGTLNVNGGTLDVDGALKTNKNLFISGNSTVTIENLVGRATVMDDTTLTNSYIKSATNGTTRVLGDLTLNGGFGAGYFMTAGSTTSSAGYEGTITIEDGTTVNVSYGVEMNGNVTLNGGTIDLSGGNASGSVWGCVFQSGTFEINSDIIVNGDSDTAPVHFTNATATVNGSITQSKSGGEPIYVGEGSTVTFGDDAVITTDCSVHVSGTLKSSGDVYGTITKAMDTAVIEITGGTYTQDVSEWCARGFSAEDNGDGTYTVALANKVSVTSKYGALVGTYSSLKAAVDNAEDGDVLTVIADLNGEAVEVTKSITITGDKTLNNVSITANGADVELTVSNLSFTGTSYINANNAAALTVTDVNADVTLNQADAVTNSRAAFISLGASELNNQPLKLTVTGSEIVVKGDNSPDPILGWRYIADGSEISGNTFGSEDAPNWDAVKFLNVMDEATITLSGNTVYANGNGFAFGQNNSRDNAYTVVVDDNDFMGSADYVWVEVSGATVTNATVEATSANTVTVDGETRPFTAADIKTNVATWTGYAGVGVETDANGKLIGGTYAAVAEGAVAAGYEAVYDEEAGVYTIAEIKVAEVNGVQYASLQDAIDAAQSGDTVTLIRDIVYPLDPENNDPNTPDIIVTKDVTIDFNGYYIEAYGHLFRIVADVTVKNGDVRAAETNKGGYAFFVGQNDNGVLTAGNLTIESGVYAAQTSVVSVTQGVATILGGEYSVVSSSGTKYMFNCIDSRHPETCNVVIEGGTFHGFNPSNNLAEGEGTNFCAEGYAGVNNGDGTYTVAEMPNATVELLPSLTLTAEEHDYMTWPSGDDTIDRPLEIVMNFKANDTLEEAQASAFGKYKTDFYLTVTGLANDSIIADGCYLAGNYGSYGWIVIPTDGTEIENGVEYPIVSNYDANLTYENICDYVKDFTAAIHIDSAILEANPDMKVQLALKMTNPNDETDVLTIGEPAVYDAEDLKSPVSGEIAYRAYVYDTEDCEALQVDLANVNAKESVVIKVYDSIGELLTTTTYSKGAVTADALTSLIVLDGTQDEWWTTARSDVDLTTENLPAKIELYIDGILTDTFENALGADTNVDETADYIALDCVKKPVEELPTIIVGSNMVLQNSLVMNFYIWSDYVEDTDYVVIEHIFADGRASDIVKQTIAECKENMSDGYPRATIDSIAAKEMADTIKVTVYDAEGNQKSKVYEDSVRNYAMLMLAQTGAAYEKVKPVIVDMLNYGAEAQKTFTYNTGDLANNQLTAEQQALATTEYTVTNNYEMGEKAATMSVSLKSNIVLSGWFTKATDDVSSLRAVVTYKNHRNVDKTEEIEGKDFRIATYGGTSYIVVDVNSLVVADMKQLVNIEIFNADGSVYGSGKFSVEGYAALANDDISIALAKFATSAYNYFHN